MSVQTVTLKKAEPCSICTEEIPASCKALVHKVEKTFHAFHTECLNRWLRERQTCPNCQAEILFRDRREIKPRPIAPRREPYQGMRPDDFERQIYLHRWGVTPYSWMP